MISSARSSVSCSVSVPRSRRARSIFFCSSLRCLCLTAMITFLRIVNTRSTQHPRVARPKRHSAGAAARASRSRDGIASSRATRTRSPLHHGLQAVEVAPDPRVPLSLGERVQLGLREPHAVARGALLDGDPVMLRPDEPGAALWAAHVCELAHVAALTLVVGIPQLLDQLPIALGEEDVLVCPLSFSQLLGERVLLH